jgi:RNA polymerase sigma-70 factor (ECF subfamily)
MRKMFYEELAKEYRKTLRSIRKARMKKDPILDKHDREILAEMESSTEWTLQYLELEHEPGLRRGIHRRSRQQREVLLGDMEYMATAKSLYSTSGKFADPEKVKKLERALAQLSEREREVFELVVGQCFSQYEAARMLGISRPSVQVYLKRAKKKIIS